MNALTQKFAKIMSVLPPTARKPYEIDFIKKAMVDGKKNRSGVMTLAWFYKKTKNVSFGEAQKMAHKEINERIERKSFEPGTLDYYWTKRS